MLDSSCFGRDFVFAHLANLFPASQFNALMADFVPLPMISINEFVAFLRLSHCSLGSNTYVLLTVPSSSGLKHSRYLNRSSHCKI